MDSISAIASSKAFKKKYKEKFLYLFSKRTCFSWVIEDFIVENREVKSKSKSNGVGCLKVSVSNITCSLVRSQCTI
jgi:hypothetical protein